MLITEEIKNKYKPTIGIECHVQLNTESKLFSAAGNDARQAEPNTLISHIDVGFPGALPVLNQKALELAARVAFALNTRPQKFSKFDRKHYFYPDLPKGYQITQYEDPIIKNGSVDLEFDGQKSTVRINRVHLEEDAGKNTHPEGADYSLVDLNRAGTPLVEIVSEADIHSAAEAKAYAHELYLLMKYAGVSDVDLYHGNMRFDVNISISKTDEFGMRAEVKNLNSFRSVENAVHYEINRQIELLERGEKVVQETRGWDEAKQRTISQRGKEEAHDYRYMPEPDIPPLDLDEQWVKQIEIAMPKLPPAIRSELKAIGLEAPVIEDILDNEGVYKKISDALAQNAEASVARRIAFDSLEVPETLAVSTTDHIMIAELLSDGQISSNSAKEILLAKVEKPEQSIESLASSKKQISDESAVEAIVSQVLEQNPKAAQDVKNGEVKAIGFLVGQVMAKSRGQANPTLAQELIKKQLGL